MKKHRALEPAILQHFAHNSRVILFESAADIQGVDQTGNRLVGEFKSKNEIRTNSWWNHWEPYLSKRSDFGQIKGEPARVRAWIAVILGQLADYCQAESVATGHLVVEEILADSDPLAKALVFLKELGAIHAYDIQRQSDVGLTFVIVHYHAT